MTAEQISQSMVQFGVARGDITSPVGIYHRMWGAATHEQAAGVHRPLTATVALFESCDGSSRQLLIAVDHCVLGEQEIALIKEAVSAKCSISAEEQWVVCSHTHAAGLMLHDRAHLPGGDQIPPYLRQMSDTIASLGAEACESRQACTIVYGAGRCELARNRDFWDAERGEYVCGYNPDGVADDTVMVARVTDARGETVATFVNYACHPTTLSWGNQLISPDYPGALREVVEAAVDAPCIFLQGVSGDLGPRDGFVGDTDVADRNGRVVGHAAAGALLHLPPPATHYVYQGAVVSGATIGVWDWESLDENDRQELQTYRGGRHTLPMEYRPELPQMDDVRRELSEHEAAKAAAAAAGDEVAARDAHAMIERANRSLGKLSALPDPDHFPLQYGCWRMGDAVWVILQGEPYNVLQRELRDRFRGRPLMIVTIAETWGASYLPPQECYGQPLYQESIAIVKAGSLERLIEQLSDDIQALFQD